MSARHKIADALGCDVNDISPYQHGRHRPALWTDGEAYFCVAANLPENHAGLAWRRMRTGSSVWVSELVSSAD